MYTISISVFIFDLDPFKGQYQGHVHFDSEHIRNGER